MDFDELKGRYEGAHADKYEQARSRGPKWRREQTAVTEILSRLPPGTSVLDVPVGTGRFIELYKHLKFSATGVDASRDMLRQAKERAESVASSIRLLEGDIRHLDATAGEYDAVVCIRFLNWIDFNSLNTVLAELARVTRCHLIIGIRTYLTASELGVPHPRGLVRWVLQQAWRSLQWNGKLFVHKSTDTLSLFSKHRLEIIEAICTDEHRGGSNYTVYYLQKSPLKAAGSNCYNPDSRSGNVKPGLPRSSRSILRIRLPLSAPVNLRTNNLLEAAISLQSE